jgi:cathepsin L
MQGLVCLLVLSSLALSMAMPDTFTQHLWNKFKKSHGKVYLSLEHETYRFGIFKKNIELIEKHNTEYSMGMHTYTLGVNPFADWTFAEFKENMLGTRYNASMTRGSASVATFARLPAHLKAPESVDWREEGAVTPVKNQGQCGSCWAFSTTGSLEAAHFRLTNELVSLSEQQLVDCSAEYHNAGCNGGLMDNAFEYIKTVGGLQTEESYPYHAKQGKCHFKKTNVGATCTGFVDVPEGDEEALRDALASVGPVSVAIDATEDKFMLYKDGIFVDDGCSNGQEDLDHGVLVVGYGTNTTHTGEQMGYWTVKNSWGPEWGEGGYIRMARNQKNMCGIATSASYPLVKEDN